jgi:Na+-driven multidrug efflux pump
MTAMAVLRAHGDAKASMYVTVLGGIVNAVLDPLFIFGFDLGLEGAAYASVLARGVMALGGIIYVVRAHNGFDIPSFTLIWRDAKEVIALAGPAVLTNLATPIGTAIVTREVAKFGTDAVAAMAVIGRLTPLAFAAVLALSGAIGPIVGQNYGAGQFVRVREAFKAGLIFVVAYVICVTLILFFARGLIADLFEARGEMRELIFLFCGPLALFQVFNGAIFVCNASFNNLGHPFYSTAVNWGRHTLGTLPFALAGAAIAGASGVLIGQAIGGVFFAVIGVVLAWRLTGSLQSDKDIDDFAEHKNLHQVTTRRNW